MRTFDLPHPLHVSGLLTIPSFTASETALRAHSRLGFLEQALNIVSSLFSGFDLEYSATCSLMSSDFAA